MHISRKATVICAIVLVLWVGGTVWLISRINDPAQGTLVQMTSGVFRSPFSQSELSGLAIYCCSFMLEEDAANRMFLCDGIRLEEKELDAVVSTRVYDHGFDVAVSIPSDGQRFDALRMTWHPVFTRKHVSLCEKVADATAASILVKAYGLVDSAEKKQAIRDKVNERPGIRRYVSDKEIPLE